MKPNHIKRKTSFSPAPANVETFVLFEAANKRESEHEKAHKESERGDQRPTCLPACPSPFPPHPTGIPLPRSGPSDQGSDGRGGSFYVPPTSFLSPLCVGCDLPRRPPPPHAPRSHPFLSHLLGPCIPLESEHGERSSTRGILEARASSPGSPSAEARRAPPHASPKLAVPTPAPDPPASPFLPGLDPAFRVSGVASPGSLRHLSSRGRIQHSVEPPASRRRAACVALTQPGRRCCPPLRLQSTRLLLQRPQT